MRGEEAFARLIAPISVAEFFATYWEKRYLHIKRNDTSYHEGVLRFEDVNDYLSRNDLRYPFIRLVRNGRELPLNTYSHDSSFGENLFQGNLDQDALFAEYSRGATMCMQLQHLAIPSLGQFSNHLERYFGHRTQSTVFLTPASSQGFTRHFDSHDFFSLTIWGEKTWRVYAKPEEFPLPRKEVLDSDVAPDGEIAEEITLRPGDTLYIPRGVYHEARGEVSASIHVSLGIFPHYWVDILHRLIDDLADANPRLRMAAVPRYQIDQQYLAAQYKEVLSIIAEHGDPLAAIEALQDKALSKQLKDGRNRLADYEASSTIDPDSSLVMRDVNARLREVADKVTLSFYDKRLTYPSFVKPQLEVILTGASFTPNSLPGSIDISSRTVLVKQLVKEGFVTFL